MALGLAAFIGSAAQMPAAALPNVVILATGGTIAEAQPKEGDAGDKLGGLSVETLMAAAPGVDGIVVIRGTDTMEETSCFLDLVIKSDKPVVLVGSTHPATSTSADGPLDLYHAVEVAADPAARGRGVLVVGNDDIHPGRDIQKVNTTDVQTFVSPERGIVGEICYGRGNCFNTPSTRHTTKSEFSPDGLEALPRVDFVHALANADGAMVLAAVAEGAKGIVRRNIELNDDALGFVAAVELNAQKARVQLRLSLTKTKKAREVQQMFVES